MGEPPGQPTASIAPKLNIRLAGSVEDPRSDCEASRREAEGAIELLGGKLPLAEVFMDHSPPLG